jgi:hypothetical protein
VLFSTFASAQNIAPNGQFDTLEGWTLLGNGGQLTLDAGDGSPDAPAGFLVSGGSPVTFIQSSCAPLTGPMTADFQVDIKSNPDRPDFPGYGHAYLYSDDSCLGSWTDVGAGNCFPLSNGWQRCARLNFAVPDTVRSFRVGGSVMYFGASAKFDNFRLGPSGTVPVTLQSFDIE